MEEPGSTKKVAASGGPVIAQGKLGKSVHFPLSVGGFTREGKHTERLSH